jgi:hypothetical protein
MSASTVAGAVSALASCALRVVQSGINAAIKFS